jgi:hypothetical protein
MRYALCNLASKIFLAFSVFTKRFVKYAASGFSILYWKPRFKSLIYYFVEFDLLNFVLWGRTVFAVDFGFI